MHGGPSSEAIPPINCAIFLTADKSLKYGARLSPDGKIVVGQVVPFSDIDAENAPENPPKPNAFRALNGKAATRCRRA